MHAIRSLPFLSDAATRAPQPSSIAYADDYGLVPASAESEQELDDSFWMEFPAPMLIPLPLEGEMDCHVVLPANYEPRYAYPLLIWLEPGDGEEFRSRMATISDRNFIALAARWNGFQQGASHSLGAVAACARLMQSAVAFTQSVWNIHDGRRTLLAEGSAHCDWAQRLAGHAPDRFDALICVDPETTEPSNVPLRRPLAIDHRPMLLVTSEARHHDRPAEEEHVIASWQREGMRRGWSVELIRESQIEPTTSLPRLINTWLMSRVVGC